MACYRTAVIGSAKYGEVSSLAINVHTVRPRLYLGHDELHWIGSTRTNVHRPALLYPPVYLEDSGEITSHTASIDHVRQDTHRLVSRGLLRVDAEVL